MAPANRSLQSVFIPGLTPHAFQAGTRHTAPTPKLVQSQVDDDGGGCGSFEFAWTAKGSSSSAYKVTAKGTKKIEYMEPQSREHGVAIFTNVLQVDCSCPSYNSFRERNKNSKTYVTNREPPSVCKHIFAALSTVLDETATANVNAKVKELQLQRPPTNNSNHSSNKRSLPHPASFSHPVDEDDEDGIADLARRNIICKNNMTKKNKKRALGTIEAPIKLFCTVQDDQLRKQQQQQNNNNNNNNHKNHWSFTQCRTLREMLGLDGTNSNNTTTTPPTKIQWLVIANYLVDFDYLLNQIPELLSIPYVVVFYAQAMSDPTLWKNRAGRNSNKKSVVDFVQLNPRDPCNSATNPLRYVFYGVHHTKMFLVGRTDDTVRVVIHTANLQYCDIHNKAQAAYIQDFGMKKKQKSEASESASASTITADTENHPEESSSSEFQDTLINYMTSYGYKTTQPWLGEDRHPSESLTECLCRYDYSTAQAVLIPSVPGYYKLFTKHRMGHLKLKQAVAEHAVYSVTPRPIVCQFSSLGMLSENYLRQLEASMDTGLARRDYDPAAANKKKSAAPLQLQFVYPTVDEICNSIEGYAGGASVPGKLRDVNKPFMRPLLRKWTGPPYNPWANNAASAAGPQNPLQKPQNVPHIKTWYQVSEAGDSMDWLVVTSHNLSKAAWGEIRKSKNDGSLYHYVSSWELGVFVSPSVLGVDKLVYWSDAGTGATILRNGTNAV